MIPSEFIPNLKYRNILQSQGLRIARMLSGSKSGYKSAHPGHDVYFNANIIIESEGKIWHGDLDLTLDIKKLKKVRKIIGEPIYILRESDARWDNENLPIKELIEKAITKI